MSANDRQPGSGVQAASRSSQSNRAVLSVGLMADEELWACPEAEGAGKAPSSARMAVLRGTGETQSLGSHQPEPRSFPMLALPYCKTQ